ncbi:hypothetical protein [Synechococcus phage Ssp-JY38]|nr:hypothetical protein [Synechococcus phage Yong-L2-223]
MQHPDIRDVVNDTEWQALRGGFVGTWKRTPAANVVKLREYLGPLDAVEYLRFRRVYNYLTGSAFRIGVIQHPDIDVLLSELRAIRELVYQRNQEHQHAQ